MLLIGIVLEKGERAGVLRLLRVRMEVAYHLGSVHIRVNDSLLSGRL